MPVARAADRRHLSNAQHTFLYKRASDAYVVVAAMGWLLLERELAPCDLGPWSVSHDGPRSPRRSSAGCTATASSVPLAPSIATGSIACARTSTGCSPRRSPCLVAPCR